MKRKPPQPYIVLDDLYGEHMPSWFLERTRERFEGWRKEYPTQAPGSKLLFEWALDYSELMPVHRRALDVLSKFKPGTTWADHVVAPRIGVDPDHWRKQVRPALVEWGWLAYSPGTGRHGCSYAVGVPVAEPPNRMLKPGRARPQDHPPWVGEDHPPTTGKITHPHRQDHPPRVGQDHPPRVAIGRQGREGRDREAESASLQQLDTGYREPPAERQLKLGADDLAKARTARKVMARRCAECGAGPGDVCRNDVGAPIGGGHRARRVAQ